MNVYTLEGANADGVVGSVIASSSRIRTVRGFLRREPKLLKDILRRGYELLFVRFSKCDDGECWEVNESVDQMEIDGWVKRGKNWVAVIR